MNGREEIEANISDLMEIFPLFTKYASILRTDARNIDDEWPGYRTWPGYDLFPPTPIRGLYNVGDGVKPFGRAGLPASAESGEEREVKKGDFALVLPDEKHQYKNKSTSGPMLMICAVPKEYE